ncbi:MAG TPA: YcxB family protein [Pyrinomonadaceae bacterium]|nr:YcxB family protein [Pyrinomonadaceae bacterium]
MGTLQLNFQLTEKEYIAAIRLYALHSTEILARLIILWVLVSAGLFLLTLVLDFALPIWALIAMIGLVGVALTQGYLFDRPRRYFRGNPKFRDEYHLAFSDSGIEFKTQSVNATLAWSMFTRVIENDKFYLTVYGKDLHSVSVIPKRAFVSTQQEASFREMLRRHVDSSVKLETTAYLPPNSPPDWR